MKTTLQTMFESIKKGIIISEQKIALYRARVIQVMIHVPNKKNP